MAARPGTPPPEALVERFQELSTDLERIADPSARRHAEELISVVLDLYGEGLRRIFAALEEGGEGTEELRTALAEDGVVASLMLIHDLYPVGLEERVQAALDSVRPYMESHGGDVGLLSVDAGVATIRLSGSCDGCPASSATLELAIKQALDEHAPDLEGLEVEGAANGNGAVEAPSSWFPLRDVGGLEEGELTPAAVAGNELIVARVDGSLLAYRDGCASCGSRLAGAELVDGVLRCSGCERRYYLPRAGRSLDDEGIQLEPVPLLAENGSIRVALAA